MPEIKTEPLAMRQMVSCRKGRKEHRFRSGRDLSLDTGRPYTGWACRFLCQINQRPKGIVNRFSGGKHFRYLWTEEYKVCAFAIVFKVFAADSYAKVFPFVLRAKFV